LRQVLHTIHSDERLHLSRTLSQRRSLHSAPLSLENSNSKARSLIFVAKTLKYCAPVGSHPRVTQMILKRAAEIAPDVPLSKTSLLIRRARHQPFRRFSAAAAERRSRELIRNAGRCAEVSSAYMEEAPLILRESEPDLPFEPDVVVVPFFIADGLRSYHDTPGALGFENEPGPAASSRDVLRHNPHQLRDRRLYYASSIGTEPDFAELILDQVASI